MPRLRHSHNAGRHRARLISTPGTTYPDLEGSTVTTTIEGIKFSDQLGALLDHARAHGFRLEPSSAKGNRAGAGVMVYAPDKDVTPFNVTELRSKFNPAHYDNLKRQLQRAGMPPMPGDTKKDDVALVDNDDFARTLAMMDELDLADFTDLTAEQFGAFVKAAGSAGFVGAIASAATKQAGYGLAEADLVGSIVQRTLAWADAFSPDRIHAASEKTSMKVEAAMRHEVDAALAMAAEHEARANREAANVERAEAARIKAAGDCRDALRRAEAAEERAAELEAAINPLRALLGKV